MRKKIDFSKATQGPVLDTTDKEYVAIGLDSDVYEYFGSQAEKQGRGYQGLIDALRTAMDTDDNRHYETSGPVVDAGKARFPLWLDSDVLSHFRKPAGGRGTDYQGLINKALRDAMHEASIRSDDPAGQTNPAQAIGQS
jgi:uncharacterized protein (DUF4415 family)